MATYSRIEVALKMKECGVIPVFYHSDIDTCKEILKACYNAGLVVFEFTNRGDFAHEVFAALSKYAARELPGMMLGVGSILDAATAALYLQLGANFIVAPILDPETAVVCNRRKALWAPGCGSLTEINKAHELGAEVVKIFPGESVGGPEFIKAVRGPMPRTSIMPTGGVQPTEENLKAWFSAGAHCVGMGSQLFAKSLVDTKFFGKIEEDLKEVVKLVAKCRS